MKAKTAPKDDTATGCTGLRDKLSLPLKQLNRKKRTVRNTAICRSALSKRQLGILGIMIEF